MGLEKKIKHREDDTKMTKMSQYLNLTLYF